MQGSCEISINGANFIESHILHFFLLSVPDFIEGPAMPPWQSDWKVDRRFTAAETATLMGHYLQALTMRRKADQMTALFGGKVPHPPSFIPGGITCTPRQQRINDFNAFLDEMTAFIKDVYIPDVKLLVGQVSGLFHYRKRVRQFTGLWCVRSQCLRHKQTACTGTCGARLADGAIFQFGKYYRACGTLVVSK